MIDAGNIKRNILRSEGYQINVRNGRSIRMTRQRKVILEELRREYNHPSADEVYEAVRKQLPRISLGTVYRKLEILRDLLIA